LTVSRIVAANSHPHGFAPKRDFEPRIKIKIEKLISARTAQPATIIRTKHG
jgi:hypothetical protein